MPALHEFHPGHLKMQDSKALDVTLGQLLSPMPAEASPTFQYFNYMDEASDVTPSATASRSERSEYLDEGCIGFMDLIMPDLELLAACASPSISDEGRSDQYNCTIIPDIDIDAQWSLLPLPSLEAANPVNVMDVFNYNLVNVDNTVGTEVLLAAPSPVYDAKDVPARIRDRRDSALDIAAPITKKVVKRPTTVEEEEDTTSDGEDSNYSNDSEDEKPRKQTSKTANRRKTSNHVTAGNGRITKPCVAVLSKVLEQTCYPETSVRKLLAERMNMRPRTVQIWFQNKRQYMKASGVSEGLRNKRGDPYKIPTGKKVVIETLGEDVERWCDEAGF
ncbi:hypothetical protein SmJEL517_g01220 [Synchytrium microbalum]|uniref:Homeobox domain-containing protein n=1 Tax=Synchytrium microbalum TaxID=1806994 RepID=A0A507CBJ0_9FUNG|nr:uncharacterized protein SmJEL517_g01220 [Synchytrium microbalum]TPX36698.1 hypothetical protein SmJEL517_g01220 [Synchytrium microbalum]